MTFNTYDPDTASTFQYYTPPQRKDLNSTYAFGVSKKNALKLLGFNDNGQLNAWGKAVNIGAPLWGGPLGVAVPALRDTVAKSIASDTVAEQGIADRQQKDLRLGVAGAELLGGAALGLTGAGAPAAVPLITKGGIGVAQNIMQDGGFLQGGSHASGKDLAVVDKQTGSDTGVRMEGGELLFSRERTEALKDAVANCDYGKLMKIAHEQIMQPTNKSEYANGGTITEPTYLSDAIQPQQISVPYLQQPEMGGLMERNTTMTMPTTPNEDIPLMPMRTMYATEPTMQYADVDRSVAPTIIGGGTASTPSTDWMSYLKYTIPIAQTALGATAALTTKLPEYTPPADFLGMIERRKRMANEGLNAQENILLDKEAQDAYRLGVDNIYKASGGNAGAILGNQNALASDLLNFQLKKAAMNSAERKANIGDYENSIAKELELSRDAYGRKYNQAAGTRAAGGNLLGVGLLNAQDAFTADDIARAYSRLDKTEQDNYMNYLKNKK